MRIELSLKAITWFGKKYEDKTAVSPYSYIKEEGFSDEDKKVLIEQGIIDENEKINTEAEPLLNLLSIVKDYVIFKFTNGVMNAQKTIFFIGENTISVITRGDIMQIEMPADNSEIIDFVKSMTGISDATSSDLDIETDCKTALVFAAAADKCRSRILKSYSEFSDAKIEGSTKTEILDIVNSDRKHSQKITSLISNKTGGEIKIDEKDIEESLKILKEKELVAVKDDIIYPAGDGVLFCGSFLTIENYFSYIIGQEKNGELYKADFDIVQAGIRDALLIEDSSDNKISLKSIPAEGIVQITEKLLSKKPSII